MRILMYSFSRYLHCVDYSSQRVPLFHNFKNSKMHMNLIRGKSKGKAIPLQAWRGPEVSRRLRFPDFKTIGT
jgi:hypothetical protein